MDWLTFFARVLTSIPLAVVIVTLAFYRPLSRLLDRIKAAKGFGGEVDFSLGLDKAEDATRALVKQEAPEPAASTPPELPAPVEQATESQPPQLPRMPTGQELEAISPRALNRLLLTPPAYQVTQYWKRFEDGFLRLCKEHGITTKNTRTFTSAFMLNVLGFSDDFRSRVEEIKALRDNAAHGTGLISETDALRYSDLVDELLKLAQAELAALRVNYINKAVQASRQVAASKQDQSPNR